MMGSAIEIARLSLGDAARLTRARELSVAEVVESTLGRIERYAHALNCLISVRADEARREARVADDAYASGHGVGPLHGVAVVVKDNIAVAGLRRTCGSEATDGTAMRDAEVVSRLRTAGAIVTATANMYEFAYGSPHPAFGRTRNPIDPRRSCAGSSSGSAAAVAAGLCHAAIGTDSGGSVRAPASFCGVVGFKPTYHRLSRDGVVPVSWSVDHVGPLARSVADLALVYRALVDKARAARRPSRTRVGVLGPDAWGLADLALGPAIARASDALRDSGAEITVVPLPSLAVAQMVMWVITNAEAYTYHRPWLETRGERYGPSLRARLGRGAAIAAADYVHAQRLRERITREVRDIFSRVDVVLLPTMACGAFAIGATEVAVGGGTLSAAGTFSFFNALANLTGQPAVTIPCAEDAHGLTLGLQLIGRPGDDEDLLDIAAVCEASLGGPRSVVDPSITVAARLEEVSAPQPEPELAEMRRLLDDLRAVDAGDANMPQGCVPAEWPRT